MNHVLLCGHVRVGCFPHAQVLRPLGLYAFEIQPVTCAGKP